MKKAGLTVFLLLVVAFGAFAQITPRAYCSDGYRYSETEGYCIVEGARLHYWLYDSQNFATLKKAFMDYAEGLGYTIDYDNRVVYSPNPNLANSVKVMMSSKNSDVSMTIVKFSDGATAMIINRKTATDYFETEVYPLIK
jgi:hypothetical protein